jgi:glycerophosphoryl diester phosphodiesterase
MLLEAGRPLVIAHRGFSAMAPENTLPAFQRALDAGADLVELDYHHTREGLPVVIHDRTLDRTTNAPELWSRGVPVAERTFADLRELDAGRWKGPGHAGARLPLLTEALDLIQSRSVTLIERKAGDAATCAALLRERKLVNHVVVQAFDWDFLRDLRRELPEQVLAALGPPHHSGQRDRKGEKFLEVAHLDEIAAIGARIVVWNRHLSRESVQAAHARGLLVWAYTIDDPAETSALLDWGVDGIITNDPAAIRELAASRKREIRP